MSQDYDDYLKYADLYDKPNPIMAQYCRVYYLQERINLMKKNKIDQNLQPNDSILINSILKKTEQAMQKITCTMEERKIMIEKELDRMYERVMQSAPTDEVEKDSLRRRLLVLLDLIQVLTVFAPLAPEWEKKSNTTLHIDTECYNKVQSFIKHTCNYS